MVMDSVNLTCPQCGEPTLYVESPADYEIWIKCSTCSLFMGLSEEEWSHIKNSPDLDKTIEALYRQDYPEMRRGRPCSICSAFYEEGGIFGVCSPCIFRVIVIIVVIMFISSFVLWFGVF